MDRMDQPILTQTGQQMFASIGHVPFAFEHGLGSSSLLSMDALRELAAFLENKGLYHLETGGGNRASGWSDKRADQTLSDSFKALTDGNTLILLKSVHQHPDYARLLDKVMREVEIGLGKTISTLFQRPICTIILASPRRITPYHMDDAHNLLMQVHGTKAFYVFDGSDPTMVSVAEREAFWRGDHNAARLTDARQAKAQLYELRPASGVHVPMTFPHWAENGADVSVAVSINFQPRHNTDAHLYSCNGMLRAHGFAPADPGQNRLGDTCKIAAFRALKGLRQWTGVGAR